MINLEKNHSMTGSYKKGGIVGCSQRATLTTAEVFKLMCQGVDSGSKIVVFGTHKDKYEAIEGPKETIEDKNKKLKTAYPTIQKCLSHKL